METSEEIDGYKIIEQIGAGSSSIVYKVEDKDGNPFALNLFRVGHGAESCR
jgi:RIO-like serine/threonine protein kinase